jgi:hypothetical protein
LFFLFAVPVLGQTIQIPKQTYKPGTYPIPETAVNKGISSATMTIDRSQWTDPAVTLTFKLDFSPDGGKTWFTGDNNQGWCAFGSKGGVVKDQKGNPIPSSIANCGCKDICNPANTTNHVRGTVTVVGGSLTTSGSVVLK